MFKWFYLVNQLKFKAGAVFMLLGFMIAMVLTSTASAQAVESVVEREKYKVAGILGWSDISGGHWELKTFDRKNYVLKPANDQVEEQLRKHYGQVIIAQILRRQN